MRAAKWTWYVSSLHQDMFVLKVCHVAMYSSLYPNPWYIIPNEIISRSGNLWVPAMNKISFMHVDDFISTSYDHFCTLWTNTSLSCITYLNSVNLSCAGDHGYIYAWLLICVEVCWALSKLCLHSLNLTLLSQMHTHPHIRKYRQKLYR